MKILIVGGTGLVGAHAAHFLKEKGHDVTIMSRSKPEDDSPVACFPHIAGNYQEDNIKASDLAGFDWMVFAAGADIRQQPPGSDDEAFYSQANTVAIPRFIEKARDAGIKRAVYVGTYYPQVAPEKIETSAYVRSRFLSDKAVRALNNDAFTVCSLNAPFILGHVPGLSVPHLVPLVQYAAGRIPDLPLIAPGGGVNHITVKSLSEAILGAFEQGEGGKAYLVGDENLSWKDYLEMYCELAGNPQDLPVTEEEHPMFPDVMLYAGRNAVVSYEPDNGELNYSRNNVRAVVKEIVDAYL